MGLFSGRFRLLLPLVLLGFAALAIGRPEVRGSRLVQAGVVVMFLGFAPLVLAGLLSADNALGPGFLFAFSAPVALVIVGVGTVVALTARPRKPTVSERRRRTWTEVRHHA